MFTGIVQALGNTTSIKPLSDGIQCQIQCPETFLSQFKIGDSIAVDGVCTTITHKTTTKFTCDYLEETLTKTTFKALNVGKKLNLEAAATLKSSLGGHLLSGHIDCTGTVVSFEKKDPWASLYIAYPSTDAAYLIQKGSISINGISLTIASLNLDSFSVELIPHTLENTNINQLSLGDQVNLEYDMIGKYVAKHLSRFNKS